MDDPKIMKSFFEQHVFDSFKCLGYGWYKRQECNMVPSALIWKITGARYGRRIFSLSIFVKEMDDFIYWSEKMSSEYKKNQ